MPLNLRSHVRPGNMPFSLMQIAMPKSIFSTSKDMSEHVGSQNRSHGAHPRGMRPDCLREALVRLVILIHFNMLIEIHQTNLQRSWFREQHHLSDSIVTLGVTLDSNLSFRHHVSKVCRSAHFHLRALRRHIRAALNDDMAKTVAISLIHSRIDYANSLIHGSINVRRLQCVQNSAARVMSPGIRAPHVFCRDWQNLKSHHC